MISIDRTEIETWGKKFDAKGNFPKLVGKLIRETTPKSTALRMPSGSAVNLPGWDGIVSCEETTGNVPKGMSFWEIGVNGSPTKANSDYEKRTREHLDVDKSECTYVFVTTKLWEGKETWAKEKTAQGIWKEVKVFDAIDIVEWLEDAQVSNRWFSILTQSHPYDGIYTADEYWKMLSIGPKGQLPPAVVTAGREREVNELYEFLHGQPGVKAIKGSTKDEAIAFIIAAAELFDLQTKEGFYSRSVIVEDEKSFHALRINKNAINLIVKMEQTGKLYIAAFDNGHHVLVALGPDDSFGSQDVITLPRVDADGQIQGLIKMGLPEDEARKYSKEAGRDYTILKRLLGFAPDKTKWKYNDRVRELIPALLVGRWDESIPGDRTIIETFAGEPYETYAQKLRTWLDVESPPLMNIGENWRLTSPLDAWTFISQHISLEDVEKLKLCFLEVMQETNPALALEPHERSMASLKGLVYKYSSWCREGLTQTMILIGLYGDNLKLVGNTLGQKWVDDIISKLLYEAPANFWVSRNAEMPLIAEASPVSFLKCVSQSLSLSNKPIMAMFVEEDGLWTPISHHTGLLWGLEGLAWMDNYVLDASLILTKLSALDPGGKLANRPINSLREIYKAWHYQTFASFEDRMKILERIIKTDQKTGWTLLKGMISKGPSSATQTHTLRWRLFDRNISKKYSLAEVLTTQSHVVSLLIKYFDFSEKQLIDLLDRSESTNLLPKDRDAILSFIDENLDKVTIIDNSAWDHVRHTLSHHKSYPDAEWALKEDVLSRYEKIYDILKPTDTIQRVAWIFNEHWPRFPEGELSRNLSYLEKLEAIQERRIQALKSLYEQLGFSPIKEFARNVKEPLIYGDTLGFIIQNDEEILSICDFLKEEDIELIGCAQIFISRKTFQIGLNWLVELYEKLKEQKFPTFALARLFHRVQQNAQLWKFIEEADVEISTSYWKSMSPMFSGEKPEDFNYAISKLLEVRRFSSALEMTYYETAKLQSNKLIELLVKFATEKSTEDIPLESFKIAALVENAKTRDDIEPKDLFRLEWLFLPILSTYGSNQKPDLLYKELATAPDFFIEVLEWIYTSDTDEPTEGEVLDDLKRNRGIQGFRLLNSWQTIPGVDDKGVIDIKFLTNWIDEARGQAEKVGRLQVADSHIGRMLANYPEQNEPWPPAPISNILEAIGTKAVLDGFSAATANKRGSSTRGPFDGGDIERSHAKFFRAQAKAIKYDFPKISGALDRLAEGYEDQAKKMDEQAEMDKLDS